MKRNFTIIKLFFVFCFIAALNSADAQISGSFSNLCFDKDYKYELTLPPTCDVQWTVSGGDIVGSSTSSTVTVKWRNVSNGAISATFKNKVGVACQTSSPPIRYVTIKRVTTPSITNSSGYIACGGRSLTINATSVTNATHYGWSLPAGFNGVNASYVTTITPSITVQVTAAAEGRVSVRGYNSSCKDADGYQITGGWGHKDFFRYPGTPTLSSTLTRTEVCSGESLTFTLTQSRAGTNFGYDWYATNGLRINGGLYTASNPLHTTSNSVTVTATSGSYGMATVGARLNNGLCAPGQYVGKKFQVGSYSSDQFYISSSATQYCPNTNYYFSARTNTSSNTYQFNGVTDYKWQWPSDWTYMGGQGTKHLDLRSPYNFYNSSAVVLKVVNRCGTTGSPAIAYLSKSYSCGGYYSYSVQPNPASDYLEIVPDVSEGEVESDSFEGELNIKLFDKNQNIIKTKKGKKKKTVLETKDLKPGLYYLHVTDEHTTTQLQIIIEK